MFKYLAQVLTLKLLTKDINITGSPKLRPYVLQEAQVVQQPSAVQRQEVLSGRHRQVQVQERLHDGRIPGVLVPE